MFRFEIKHEESEEPHSVPDIVVLVVFCKLEDVLTVRGGLFRVAEVQFNCEVEGL